MENIDRFNLYTAHILSKLYGEFPVGVKLDPGGIVKEVDPNAAEREGNAFVAYTLKWLVATGYLIEYPGATKASNKYVLAPKALEAMSASPSSLSGSKGKEAQKTLGQKLSEKTKEIAGQIATETQKQSISQLVGEVIGRAMRTWSNS